jgi:hypothetical protein
MNDFMVDKGIVSKHLESDRFLDVQFLLGLK